MSNRAASPRVRLVLLGVLAVSASVRLWLAVGFAPAAGFAADMNTFLDWAHTFVGTGPTDFYRADPSANYPPVSVLIIGGLQKISVLAVPAGGSADQLFLILLKLPAVIADVVTAGLVYLLGRDLYRPTIGVIAAALFTVVPPIWYVSTLWGQIDSVMIMFGTAALVLLCRRHHARAAVLAVLGMMVKPQGVLIVLIVVVVIIGDATSKTTTVRPGRRAVRGLLGLLPAVALALGLLTAFGYRSLASPTLRSVPVLGDLAGFLAQSVATSRLFPVLTANAYNVWALVGTPPLSWSIHTGTALWITDHSLVGSPYGLLGLILFGVALVFVLGGLLLRRDKLAILFASVVLSWAFFAFPTRVHERYLLPVFAPAAVLAAAGVVRTVGYLIAGLLNLTNLHAVLAADLRVISPFTQSNPRSTGSGARTGGPGLGGDSGEGRGGPTAASAVRAHDLRLPWADQARAEQVAVAVSVAQTAGGVVLIIGWVTFVLIGHRRQLLKRR